KADDVPRHDEIDDLALAVAQQLVSSGKALLHEAQLGELVAIEYQIAPFFYRKFGFDHRAQAFDVGRRQFGEMPEPRDDGIVAADIDFLMRYADGNRPQRKLVHSRNLDQ